MPVPSVARRAVLLIIAILIAAGLGSVAALVCIAVFDKSPSQVVKAAFDADTLTYRDGRIQLYFDVDKKRDCPTTSTRWLWTWVTYKGEQVRLFMPLGVSLAGITDIGEQHYILSLEVPRDVWDGKWYYLARSEARCGGLLSLIRHDVTETPSIQITIQGARSGAPKGIIPTPHPIDNPNIPLWRKAIVLDGKPLP
jgi:hypothetical protein